MVDQEHLSTGHIASQSKPNIIVWKADYLILLDLITLWSKYQEGTSISQIKNPIPRFKFDESSPTSSSLLCIWAGNKKKATQNELESNFLGRKPSLSFARQTRLGPISIFGDNLWPQNHMTPSAWRPLCSQTVCLRTPSLSYPDTSFSFSLFS